MLEKIISGGQTGADMGGLLAGRELGLETGGTAPRGWKTENGSESELLSSFGLIENITPGWKDRTIKNVINSDGTIAFLLHKSPGTQKTIGYCIHEKWVNGDESNNDGFRPVLVLDSEILKERRGEAVEQIRAFVVDNNIGILNIAGHRQSSVPRLDEAVKNILVDSLGVFSSTN